MQIDTYTDHLKGLIQAAQSLAQRKGHQRLTPLHLLKALLNDDDGLAKRLIQSAGGRPDGRAVDRVRGLATLRSVEGGGAGQIFMAPETARLFDRAEVRARAAGDSFVT